MSLLITGTPGSAGLVVGYARRLMRHAPEVVRREISGTIRPETERFRRALRRVRAQLMSVRDSLPKDIPGDVASFIDAHLLILDDPELSRPVIDTIKRERCNAEWALKLHHDSLRESFRRIDDPYLRERVDDIDHVVGRLMRSLTDLERGGATPLAGRDQIAIAEDLSPDDLTRLQGQGIAAIVTERGGRLSHTAITARSLGIPAVVAVHGAIALVREGERLICDGDAGMLTCGLDEHAYTRQRRAGRERERRRTVISDGSGPSRTRDGQRVVMDANIERDSDVRAALEARADGVGLFRTEQLFLNRETRPDEEEQYQVYRKLIRSLRGKPVTIRTLDLWAHARIAGLADLDLQVPDQGQPALGMRAVRLCLHHPELFRPQLRALLRASASGPLRVLIPMISSISELRRCRALMEELRAELADEGHSLGDRVELGVMVEVPAVAVSAHLFARECDFLAIGTNDLVQYTLAIDRDDDSVQYLYDPLNPAVLSLVRNTLEAGKRQKTPVTLCGEMAGDPLFTRLLLGLGLRHFSMHPAALGEARRIIASTDVEVAARAARRLIQQADPRRAEEALERLNSGVHQA